MSKWQIEGKDCICLSKRYMYFFKPTASFYAFFLLKRWPLNFHDDIQIRIVFTLKYGVNGISIFYLIKYVLYTFFLLLFKRYM